MSTIKMTPKMVRLMRIVGSVGDDLADGMTHADIKSDDDRITELLDACKDFAESVN